MKKTFIVILFVLFLGLSLNGQDYKTSIGLRAGYPYGLTIKHFMNENNAVEGILASNWGGFVATVLLENEHWTGLYPGFNWYWGLGAHIGFWDAGANRYVTSTYTGSVIGIDGILGLEYTFDKIPLNLSIDILPSINLFGSTGWGGPSGALSIRYVF
ncbi:MAG: hypothetical protein C0408_04305 [Odoribacter sp.]|nr:hypothetical protein [Odoribacter sp.]